MKKVLILNPCYYPGFRSGGPQRTVMNLVDVFGETNDIYILTQNCDMGCSESYDVDTHKWVRVGYANVMYLPPNEYNIKSIKKISESFDTIYSCGLFCGCTISALLLHKFEKIQKLYVAPMGVFSRAAIASKAMKKRMFLFVFKYLGLFDSIIWSFTSQNELREAKSALGKTIKKYIIAEDLLRKIDFDTQIEKVCSTEETKNDVLRILFLSRISPKKNLEYCVHVLNDITDIRIEFDIYGTIENNKYWDKCKKELNKLPENIHYHYCGEVDSSDVIDVFAKYDVFLFPTKGENFGHVIYEALAAGCIPIISDQTPWQQLNEYGCGCVVSLDSIDEFRNKIRYWAGVSHNVQQRARKNAIQFAKEKYLYSTEQSGYKVIFD